MVDFTQPLPDGSYGDLVLSKPAHVRGGKGAVFNSITVNAGASGSIIEGVTVALTPTAKINCNSSVIMVNGANDVQLLNLAVRAGMAVSGVPETFIPPIPAAFGSNVIGWPTSRGITVQYAKRVTVQGCEISACYRGIVTIYSDTVAIEANHIHDLRGTPISSGAVDNLTIARNWLHDSKPWGWGNAAADHGDFIHCLTDGKQTAPTQNLTISRNLIDQGAGVALLGISLQDTPACRLGFVNTVLDGNVILNGNHQGYRLEHVQGVLRNSIMLQTSGGPKDPPVICLATSSTIAVSNCSVEISNCTGSDSGKFMTGKPGCTILPPGVRPQAELAAARAAALAVIFPKPNDLRGLTSGS